MKTRKTQRIAKAVSCGAVLMAACLFGSPAKAQAGFQGKFTIPYEVHWGRATLPAGDYLINYDGPEMPGFVIRDAHTLRVVALERVEIRENCTGGNSALLISRRGTQRAVYSLRIAELGKAFVYEPALAHQRAVEDAHQTGAVPVIVAKR